MKNPKIQRQTAYKGGLVIDVGAELKFGNTGRAIAVDARIVGIINCGVQSDGPGDQAQAIGQVAGQRDLESTVILIADIAEHVIGIEGGQGLADIEISAGQDRAIENLRLESDFELRGLCGIEEHLIIASEVSRIGRNLYARGDPLREAGVQREVPDRIEHHTDIRYQRAVFIRRLQGLRRVETIPVFLFAPAQGGKNSQLVGDRYEIRGKRRALNKVKRIDGLSRCWRRPGQCDGIEDVRHAGRDHVITTQRKAQRVLAVRHTEGRLMAQGAGVDIARNESLQGQRIDQLGRSEINVLFEIAVGLDRAADNAGGLLIADAAHFLHTSVEPPIIGNRIIHAARADKCGCRVGAPALADKGVGLKPVQQRRDLLAAQGPGKARKPDAGLLLEFSKRVFALELEAQPVAGLVIEEYAEQLPRARHPVDKRRFARQHGVEAHADLVV